MRQRFFRIAPILFLLAFLLALVPGNALAMNKAELIEAMASHAGLSNADSKKALEGFTSATAKALTKGDRISLIGFGSFSVSKAAQQGGNIPAEKSVRFLHVDLPERPNESVVDTDALAGLIYEEICPVDRGEEKAPPEDGPKKEPVKTTTEKESKAEKKEAEKKEKEEKPVLEKTVFRCGGDAREAEAVRAALDGFINATSSALARGENVTIDGFGEFYTPGAARTGRNPQTGKEIKIAAKNVVKFKAGAELSGQVN